VIVNSAGCGAHMSAYGELSSGADLPVSDVMAFLHEHGLGDARLRRLPIDRVAYHDACHALRAQGIHAQPRALLGSIPGLQIVEIASGDACCGAAGLYNVTQPELSSRLRTEKAEALRESGASVVASANPGCTMQLRAGLLTLGVEARVVHPIELIAAALDRR
jgi:glycolate oxidase iron-sulfur subunit